MNLLPVLDFGGEDGSSGGNIFSKDNLDTQYT